MKKVLITGITGQDGSYLAELLLEKGYEVHGLRRRGPAFNQEHIAHLCADPHIWGQRLFIHEGDLSDITGLSELLYLIQPDELYNLAAQSHVKLSFDQPEYTGDVTGLGALRLLEAIRRTGMPIKFYQAGSSEMYGKVRQIPQSEDTPFYPRSPYGVAKVYAYFMTINYRESYGMFACNGILFNHESPRRGEMFVTRKITKAVAAIAAGLQDKLMLGNIDAKRDWGFAKEYVEAMWLMMQSETPDDYVIATGETHSIREFLDTAFSHVGLHYGDYVEIDPKFYRPADVELVVGNPGKARHQLGWKPKTEFHQLVQMMVDADVAALKNT